MPLVDGEFSPKAGMVKKEWGAADVEKQVRDWEKRRAEEQNGNRLTPS